MAAIRRAHLPQDVKLFADALDAAIPGSLSELVSDFPAPRNPQSLNRYAYVINNPANIVDPSGYFFGFFAALFSFFWSVGSSIASGIGTVGSTLGSAASSIGSNVGGFLNSVAFRLDAARLGLESAFTIVETFLGSQSAVTTTTGGGPFDQLIGQVIDIYRTSASLVGARYSLAKEAIFHPLEFLKDAYSYVTNPNATPFTRTPGGGDLIGQGAQDFVTTLTPREQIFSRFGGIFSTHQFPL